MVTKVGIQINFINAIKDLIELEYDALEAYEVAIDRVENDQYKAKLSEFAADHRKHISNLSNFVRNENEDVPTGPSTIKQWITKGKVILADMMSDEAILSAMSSNEVDTNTAYDRILNREDVADEVLDTLRSNREDERRHKQWLDETVKNHK